MPLPLEPVPLTDAELATLDAFLDRAGGEIGTIEMLDGFFTALVVGPEPIMPSGYLPSILGDPADPDSAGFATMEEAQAILSLLMRHWNHLAGTLSAGGYWDPLVAEDEADHPGSDWAKGFLAGVDLARAAWSPYINDEQRAGALVPIFVLAYEDHPDPELRAPTLTPEKRDELLLLVVAGISRMYQDLRTPPAAKRRTGNRARPGRKRRGR